MKVLLVLAVLVTVTQAAGFLFTSLHGGCKTDTDCGKDGCCHHRLFKNTCTLKLQMMSRCLIQNTKGKATCQNTCTPGLQCIDESKLDIALEPSYQNGNYGRCMTPGAMGPVTKPNTTPMTSTMMATTMADE